MRRDFQALGRLKKGQQNKTEARYGQYLELQRIVGEIQWYKFGCVKLRLAGNTTLTVDYVVLRADGVLEMHDCKGSPGVYLDDAKVKMKVAAETFPFVFKVAYPDSRRTGQWIIEEI